MISWDISQSMQLAFLLTSLRNVIPEMKCCYIMVLREGSTMFLQPPLEDHCKAFHGSHKKSFLPFVLNLLLEVMNILAQSMYSLQRSVSILHPDHKAQRSSPGLSKPGHACSQQFSHHRPPCRRVGRCGLRCGKRPLASRVSMTTRVRCVRSGGRRGSRRVRDLQRHASP